MSLTLDHLVYAAPDLEGGVAAIEALTGVRAAPGGRHMGLGTHNALVSLGSGAYIEIIAPDPGQGSPARPLPFGLPGLAAPRLAAWAVRARGLPGVAARARAMGYDPGPILEMSRERPDGTRLSWRLALREGPVGDGLVPFLIEWDPGPHPAETSPRGCELVSVRAEHPDPGPVRAALDALGVDLDIAVGAAPRLIAVVRSLRGVVEIS